MIFSDIRIGIAIGAGCTAILFILILVVIFPTTPNSIWQARAIDVDCGYHDPRNGKFILGPYPFKDWDARLRQNQQRP